MTVNNTEETNLSKQRPNDEALHAEILNRLKKIEGQVRGVQKMITECRSCGDVVTQLAAIKAAVNRVGISVLTCHLEEKVNQDLSDGKDIKESLDEFSAMFKKFF